MLSQNVRGGKLNYSGRYIKIGDRYWRDEDFKTLATIIFLMAAMALLLLRNYTM
jgi:hypothetical protein